MNRRQQNKNVFHEESDEESFRGLFHAHSRSDLLNLSFLQSSRKADLFAAAQHEPAFFLETSVLDFDLCVPSFKAAHTGPNKWRSLELRATENMSSADRVDLLNARSAVRLAGEEGSVDDFPNGCGEITKTVKLYGSLDSKKLLATIQRELKMLVEFVPFVSSTVIQLSEIFFHYEECSRCSGKFSEHFPWALRRIQKLNKIAKKRRGKGDFRRFINNHGSSHTTADRRVPESFSPETQNRQRVDALALAGDRPGHQIHILVKSDERKKRFFERLTLINGEEILPRADANRATLISALQEVARKVSAKILRGVPPPGKVSWQRKQKLVAAIALGTVSVFSVAATRPGLIRAKFLIPFATIEVIEKAKEESYPYGWALPEERILLRSSIPMNIWLQRNGVEEEFIASEGSILDGAKLSLNAAEITATSIENAGKEDTAQIRDMGDLELEVKRLKDLMMEVHQNQVELSKVLLEKGMYSLPMIKLTDPRMLEEETKAVRKAAEMESPGQTSSAKTLQEAVNALKRKCTIKNRMIVTLLKGLKSNVPKEWWEELVDYLFNEPKPIEEIDTEKVSEFMRRKSLHLVTGKKASLSNESSPAIPDSKSADNLRNSNCSIDALAIISRKNGQKEAEDFEEATAKKKEEFLKKQSNCLTSILEPKHTSSFIQNILYEDSQAGIEVVDLFVAIKRAKNKLEQLTKVNNEATRSLNALSEAAGTIKTDYRELVTNLSELFDGSKTKVINAAKNCPLQLEIDNSDNFESCKNVLNFHCKNVWTANKNNCETQNSLQKIKICGGENFTRDTALEIRKSEMNSRLKNPRENISKYLLGRRNASSSDANFFADAGGEVRIIKMRADNSMAALMATSLKKIGDLDGVWIYKKPSEQVTSDICEIFSVVAMENCENDESRLERTSRTHRRQASLPMKETAVKTEENVSGVFKGDRAAGNGLRPSKGAAPKGPDDAEDDGDDDISEGDSIFEEALAEPIAGMSGRLSVTCMGDLTNANRRNASTSTAENDVVETSWIGKLTEDIKARLRKLKPNFRNCGIVKPGILNKEGKPSEEVEFTINARTPVGIFNITVRQCEQFPHLTAGTLNGYSETDEQIRKSSSIKGVLQYSSDESFQSSGFSESSSPLILGEDDMEDFDVYVRRQNNKTRQCSDSISSENGTMFKATLKQGQVPMFRIEKYQPKYFVQEILPKRPKKKISDGKAGESFDGENNKNNDSEKDITSFKQSDDLIIYIQLEIDEDDDEHCSKKIYIECESNGDDVPFVVGDAGVTEKKGIQVVGSCTHSDALGSAEKIAGESDELEAREPPKKEKESMISSERVDGSGKEKNFSQKEPESKEWESLSFVGLLNEFSRAETYVALHPSSHAERFQVLEMKVRVPELQTALELLRKLEIDIVEAKLSDAILILPNLELELQKHLHCKGKKETSEKEIFNKTSTKEFFSAVDVWPRAEYGESESTKTENSEESSEKRLRDLFDLLSNLEEVIKSNEEYVEKIDLCDCTSSRIYDLLHALTQSIKNLEFGGDNHTKLADTLSIASKLDTAVREYDGMMTVERESEQWIARDSWRDENGGRKIVSPMESMKYVRRKVFRAVEEEAIRTEGRIERDLDKIDRLETENKEAMNFVEAFLQKTTRRAVELEGLKKQLADLSSTLSDLHAGVLGQKTEEKIVVREREPRESVSSCLGNGCPLQEPEEEPIRNTVSGLLLALDKLKMKARRKKEACREILRWSDAKDVSTEKKASRSSRSSFTAKTVDDWFCIIKDFRRLGESSIYMAWTKPEGSACHSITGYEIVVNGQLHQKVRKPQRTQAVLYSIDLTKRVDIQLFGLAESGHRILLASLTHYDARLIDATR